MRKHRSIFAAIAAVTLITVACSILSAPPSPVPGPQPGQPFPQAAQPGPQPGQPPEQPFSQPGQPEGHPQQPFSQPGQPDGHPQQPGPQPSQVGPQPDGQGPAASQPLRIDRMVNVPGGGGSAEITFEITNGEWVHITLSAGNQSMQPYGSMQYPDGMTVDGPPLNTTTNGTNQADILLTDPGRYTLTLFDGSNQGGPVSVKMVGSQ